MPRGLKAAHSEDLSPRRGPRSWTRIWLMAAIGSWTVFWQLWPVSIEAAESVRLFHLLPSQTPALSAQAALKQKPWVRRRQQVEVNAEAFQQLNRLGPAEPDRPAVVLDLFEQAVAVDLWAGEERSHHGRTWRGHIPGESESDVTLVVHDGVCVGLVDTQGRHFELDYVGNGRHELVEIDLGSLPPDHHPIAVGDGGSGVRMAPSPGGDGGTAGDDGSVVDILVAYTPAAKSAAGGQAGVEAQIILGVDTANQAYANSLINVRLRLVHTAEVAYAEAGSLSIDLGRLRSQSDGFMDTVHTLRNQYKADLVALVTENGDGCGIAYVMLGGPQPSFESSAFSVTTRSCIPNLTLAHETGHNMGNAHDRANSSVGAYPYSFGYQDPVGGFRTVMAYACSTGSCPRVRHFSNPNVTYNGRPTGIAYEGNPTAAADNARSMNNVRTTVANWRVSGDPVDGAPPTSPRNLRRVP